MNRLRNPTLAPKKFKVLLQIWYYCHMYIAQVFDRCRQCRRAVMHGRFRVDKE